MILVGATTFSITTFNLMTLSIMGLVTTLSKNDTQHNSIECHYAECRDYLNVMLRVVMLNVIMMSVVAPLQNLTGCTCLCSSGRMVRNSIDPVCPCAAPGAKMVIIATGIFKITPRNLNSA